MADPLGFVTLGIGGFAAGYLIGKALRLVARIGAYIVGLYLASLIVLSSVGVIIINWAAMQHLMTGAVNFLVNLTKSDVVTSTGAFGTTIALGAIYGAIKVEIKQKTQYRFFKKIK